MNIAKAIRVQNQEVLVDKNVYGLIKNTDLFIKKGYVRIKLDGKFFALHRLILNAKNGDEVDHINGDTLDNRRCNLRLCTHSQNNANKKSRVGVTSKYKGVYKDVRYYKDRTYEYWVASVKKDGKVVYKGTFKDEVEAAKAYDENAKIWHGEFVQLNFPDV